jgi:hypothetical protein
MEVNKLLNELGINKSYSWASIEKSYGGSGSNGVIVYIDTNRYNIVGTHSNKISNI